MELEKILNTKITLDIDLFEPYREEKIKLKADLSNKNIPNTQYHDNAKDLAKLGFSVVSTIKAHSMHG